MEKGKLEGSTVLEGQVAKAPKGIRDVVWPHRGQEQALGDGYSEAPGRQTLMTGGTVGRPAPGGAPGEGGEGVSGACGRQEASPTSGRKRRGWSKPRCRKRPG